MVPKDRPPSLPPALLAQILAAENAGDPSEMNGGNGPVQSYRDPETGRQFFASANYGFNGTGDGQTVDRTTHTPWTFTEWEPDNMVAGYDSQGNFTGRSKWDNSMRPMWQTLALMAPAIGGIASAAMSGTLGTTAAGATSAAGASGMTLAEQAAFLEANAGALAPAGEVAAGYGSTWGVGADGIIGQGATMLADGSQIDPWKLDDPSDYRNEGNNYQRPQGEPGQPNSPANNPNTPNTPSTPNSPPTTKPGGPGYTLRDGMQLASTTARVIGGLSGGNGSGNGGGGMDGEPDQRLVDAQLRSMDSQDALLQQMLANANMIMPFQRESLDFGLKTAKEAYSDYRADRAYALGRRNELSGLQDKMLADVRNFDTEDKREELAGKSIADVNQAFSSAMNQTGRMMSRRGQNPNDGRWASAVRTLIADKTLAQAAAANNARADARKEGYALTDRAAGALAQSPGLVTQSTTAGQGAGAQPIGMTAATSQTMQQGLQPAAQLAGQWGNNATNMYSAQQRSSGGNSGPDWGGYGALLAGAAKAWDAFAG